MNPLARTLCLVLLMATAGVVAAQDPLAGFTLRGEAVMRFLGFRIYEIRLWHAGTRFDDTQPYALELEYLRSFEGADIAARSVQEMRGQGLSDDALLATWEARMREIFPDVAPGDRLIGVAVPGREARFYAGQRFLGRIADPAFVSAFFAIWLDPRTSAPDLRAKLLTAWR